MRILLKLGTQYLATFDYVPSLDQLALLPGQHVVTASENQGKARGRTECRRTNYRTCYLDVSGPITMSDCGIYLNFRLAVGAKVRLLFGEALEIHP